MGCIFCKNFDFGSVRTDVEIYQHYIHTNIVHAGGSSRFPKSEQFNFCPVCGEELKGNNCFKEETTCQSRNS